MSDWRAAAAFYNRQRAADPLLDVIDDLYRSRTAWRELSVRAGWFDLVKIVRAVFLVSIRDAHRLILGHQGFRRAVQATIDTNAACAKYTRDSIRRG